jgi:hypothetical protein
MTDSRKAGDEPRLQWATSKTIGGVSEIAVMAPIKRGCPQGEKRTYEEVLRATIANMAKRHEQGLPTELDRISAIHFGRLIILRPEQYLVYSRNLTIDYREEARPGALARGAGRDPAPQFQVPDLIDDYLEAIPGKSERGAAVNRAAQAETATTLPPEREKPPEFRSWLLTLVEFDGDLKVYMRDIARFLNTDFDSIFRSCEDYPGTRNFEPFWKWIRRYQINTELFYATYPEVSVVRLKQLEAFKDRFDAFVARVRSPTGRRVASMDELFDDFLRENQQIARDFPSAGGIYTAPSGRRG